MELGPAIRLCRHQRRMTLPALASAAGVTSSYLSLLEREKRKPNFETLERISLALGMPLSLLLFVASDPQELESFSPELHEKLAAAALKLLRATTAPPSRS